MLEIKFEMLDWKTWVELQVKSCRVLPGYVVRNTNITRPDRWLMHLEEGIRVRPGNFRKFCVTNLKFNQVTVPFLVKVLGITYPQLTLELPSEDLVWVHFP